MMYASQCHHLHKLLYLSYYMIDFYQRSMKLWQYARQEKFHILPTSKI